MLGYLSTKGIDFLAPGTTTRNDEKMKGHAGSIPRASKPPEVHSGSKNVFNSLERNLNNIHEANYIKNSLSTEQAKRANGLGIMRKKLKNDVRVHVVDDLGAYGSFCQPD